MTHVLHIPERLITGKRLGRHVEHDPQSKGYTVSIPSSKIISKEWKRSIAAFDQGELGKCTAEATLGVLATEPHNTVTDDQLSDILYSKATHLDKVPGAYPPDDTGSTGLAAAKAAKQMGLTDGPYHHAFRFNEWLGALSHVGPLSLGINWYEGFDAPTTSTGNDATIAIGGDVRGGHQIECLQLDWENKRAKLINSWGPGYGFNGYVWISLRDLEQLYEESGDCTVFTKK